MTLVEGIAALLILGLSVVGYLGAFEGSARSARRATERARVAAYAEATLAQVTVGAPHAAPGAGPRDLGMRSTVARRPWRAGVTEIAVTAHGPEGEVVVLRRLVADP